MIQWLNTQNRFPARMYSGNVKPTPGILPSATSLIYQMEINNIADPSRSYYICISRQVRSSCAEDWCGTVLYNDTLWHMGSLFILCIKHYSSYFQASKSRICWWDWLGKCATTFNRLPQDRVVRFGSMAKFLWRSTICTLPLATHLTQEGEGFISCHGLKFLLTVMRSFDHDVIGTSDCSDGYGRIPPLKSFGQEASSFQISSDAHSLFSMIHAGVVFVQLVQGEELPLTSHTGRGYTQNTGK